MGGVFGVVSREDCVSDLFFGTDYHSHLGTRRGGLAVRNSDGFTRVIHNIENAQFRTKFQDELSAMAGAMGIGVISDTDDQPLIIGSHLGTFAIVTVARINNADRLVKDAFQRRGTHFSELSGGATNPTELVAALICQEATFEAGIRRAQTEIEGSCSLLILTEEGLYAARDLLGRTPLIVGEKEGSFCVLVETCAFPNLRYRFWYELGPGEVMFLTHDGIEQRVPPGDESRICSFLWVYYGYPASTYEGVNVEIMRNLSGAALARAETETVDLVAGVPDSGTGHAIGYANESRLPYCRPFVKYTPTWPRSFMPQNQKVRDEVARMKLIPIPELIEGKRLLLCEDSIVRGTQLKQTIRRLYDYGAKEVHMRPACPPLIHGCPFLNFSRSRSELDLAGRQAIRDLERRDNPPLGDYARPDSEKHKAMVDQVRKRLGLESLRYQRLSDLVSAIGLPKGRLCTYCWDGEG